MAEGYERYHATPLTRACFHTDGYVELLCEFYSVGGILLDTGSKANFVHHNMVRKMGLQVCRTEPLAFELADGRILTSDKKVSFKLWLGGVCNSIEAFVDYSKSSCTMIIGMSGFHQFLGGFRRLAKGKRVRVSVAKDVTGYRGLRSVLESSRHATCFAVPFEAGKRRAAAQFVTAGQLDGRRTRNRYRR